MSIEMSFNAQVVVTDLLVRSLENSALTVTLEAVRFLASKYGFNADEAEASLHLEKLSLSKKMMLKKASSVKKEKKEKKEKAVKMEKVKTVKLGFSLPFCGGVDEMCQAIEYNKGLFTQCNGCKVVGDYCKSCSNLMLKSGSEEPECGTVSQRMETSLYSYSDAKGRKAKSYVKYMEKKELTVEQVCSAAAGMNMTIPEEHFVVSEKSEKSEKPVKESKKRGRPAKAAKVVEMSSVDDMFNTMAQEASSPREEVEEEVVISKNEKKEKNEKKAKIVITEAEKEELIVMREAEKESKKASNASEKEFKKVQDNLNKEAQKQHAEMEKKNKLEQKAVEKFQAEIKKQEEAAALKLQKQEESAAKDAAKLQKIQDKAAAEAAKIAAKQLKAQEKSSSPKKAASPKSPKKSVTIATPEMQVEKPVVEKKKVSVKAFTHKGEHYLKSSEGVVYCAETKDEVGMWNESTQEIDEFEADEELESEDEGDE